MAEKSKEGAGIFLRRKVGVFEMKEMPVVNKGFARAHLNSIEQTTSCTMLVTCEYVMLPPKLAYKMASACLPGCFK